MQPKRIIVTGAAGFIGSHLVAQLLALGHTVVGVDNLATGHTRNLHEAVEEAGAGAGDRFEFHETDVNDFAAYHRADLVYHLAALGSIPRSAEFPTQTHRANVDGTFQVLRRCREFGISRLIYASSSSVYGTAHNAIQGEFQVLQDPPNIYAATKCMNEVQAQAFSNTYGLETIGLRFFNVYGPRQHPKGAYAAVIPRWILIMLNNQLPVQVFGDGNQSRDFTYVRDVVRALIFCLADRLFEHQRTRWVTLNVGAGKSVSLNELFLYLKRLIPYYAHLPEYQPCRPNDKKKSLAYLRNVEHFLGYRPKFTLEQGLEETVKYYAKNIDRLRIEGRTGG